MLKTLDCMLVSDQFELSNNYVSNTKDYNGMVLGNTFTKRYVAMETKSI